MNGPRDPDRLIHDFVAEGAERLHDQVYDAVRAEIDRRPQRVVIGPWRMPTMNNLVRVGLGIAAVIAVVLVGSQLFGSPTGPGGPSATPEPSAVPSPLPSAWVGLPQGPFVVTDINDWVQVTVNIASSGWSYSEDLTYLFKNDDGLDAPESVGAALLASVWPPGTGFNVYGDPCHWLTTIPETPATTPDEIAAAFAAQASTDATAPVDVTVGGFAGKAITLNVPMSYHQVPDVPREQEFADCDQNEFVFYGTDRADAAVDRNAQGAGQVDELWILDVDGAIVILDATYGPATPADLVEEMRTLAGSATFEAP